MEHAYITRDLIGHHALWKGAKVLARKSVQCKTTVLQTLDYSTDEKH